MSGRSASSRGVLVMLGVGMLALLLAPLAMPEDYSWVELGVSESGAQGVEGAWVARIGFVLFGLAVVWLAQLRHTVWGVIGTVLHLVFGVSMFGVAAFSTRPWDDAAPYAENEDFLHSLFATTMGFAFIGGVVAVMVARDLPSARAALPDIATIVITSAIPPFMSADVWGLLQRVMFLTATIWYAREALRDDPDMGDSAHGGEGDPGIV